MDSQIFLKGVGSGVRLLMASAPGINLITAPLAQAWSEYLAFEQEERINDLLEHLKNELESQRERFKRLENISTPLDQAKVFDILALVMQKVVLEPAIEKRKIFAKVFVNGIFDPIAFEEQKLLLEIFDELLTSELIILGMVSEQEKATANTIASKVKDGHEYVRASLTRLYSKGLIELIEAKNPQRLQFFSVAEGGNK